MHVYEAHGAFTTSPNRCLKRHNSGTKWKWFLATLKPYYEETTLISDNRFILQSLDHGNVGPNNTGNLMDMYKMLHRLKETADGSIDCQEDPGEQE